MPLPVVAIVGRPNVGKSTLFNRIIKRHQAIVDPTSGVTRDRHYAEAEWSGFKFMLIDTGGYLPPSEGGELMHFVREQSLIAADEADLVILLVDSQVGTDDSDQELARILLRKSTPLMLVANKIDDPSRLGLAWDIHPMGLGDPIPVSALNGFQVAELLDTIVEKISDIKPTPNSYSDPEELALAVIGAPNSGKSSLVNRLSGVNRMIVSDIPGTTRDSVDTIIKYHGKAIRLIDTAGLKRKRLGQQGLEFYATIRSLKALDRCDVAVVMVDAVQGFSSGDIRLINQAAEKGVGVMVAVNKWDLVEKDESTIKEWMEDWDRRATSLSWVPIRFISALTGQRAIKIVEEAFAIKAERDRSIQTSELNSRIVSKLISTPPPAIKGRVIRVKYAAQVRKQPPHFVFFTSYADLVPPTYVKYAERLIREEYSFKGVPIQVSFRGK